VGCEPVFYGVLSGETTSFAACAGRSLPYRSAQKAAVGLSCGWRRRRRGLRL